MAQTQDLLRPVAHAQAASWRGVAGTESLTASEQELFERFEFGELQAAVYMSVLNLRNMPSGVDAEQRAMAVGVECISGVAGDETRLTRAVEERLRRLDEAERRYQWLSGQWTEPHMEMLVKTWACGLTVVVPALARAKTGGVMMFTHEYHGDEYYPAPDDQTDEWKLETQLMFTLMIRSICRAYPASVTRGIVSFSYMADFDHDKYDHDTKQRNAEIGQLVPFKLVRMICVAPDERMKGFLIDMGPRMMRRWGVSVYDDAPTALEGESTTISDGVPTWCGGTHRVDVRACLQHLFRTEPDALELCESAWRRLEAAGQLPHPAHME
eukprot:gnl/Trimastix_PCT/3169.p1 GENE.gnl/Trimastix_PCT/3169~~gnl/Trimastix_PCT/3169.p1  ORF type:complete len:326 (+),score=74.14 gnl/Trimastix_PCT/3169:145-1122(+)